MPTIICDYCQYVGSGTEYNERISDVEDHEKTCKENPDYTDEPEIVECEITIGGCSVWMGKLVYTDEKVLEQAICEANADPDFIGFKFKDGTVAAEPFRPALIPTSLRGSIVSFDEVKTQYDLRHATHVLFRRKKQE